MRYKIHDQHGVNFLTMTVVEWVDVFTRSEYNDIVIDSLKYCQENKGLVIYAYVIMSNHIHLVARTGGENELSDVIRDFKKYAAKTIIKRIESNKRESRREWMLEIFKSNGSQLAGDRKYQFWQKGNRPIALYSAKVMWQKIDYIHLNPVNAKIVAEADHYLYSSASNYMEQEGLLEICKMDEFA